MLMESKSQSSVHSLIDFAQKDIVSKMDDERIICGGNDVISVLMTHNHNVGHMVLPGTLSIIQNSERCPLFLCNSYGRLTEVVM